MRKSIVFIAVSLVILAVALSAALSCRSAQEGPPGKVESVTIGTAPLESSALFYIAQDEGFFVDNGLGVTIRDYDTGASSFNAMLKGEVDIATPAEYPLVGSAFKKEEVRAIASISKAEYFHLIGRRDRGIASVRDLKGKKIGVVRNTIAEFYLGRFLELNGIDTSRVTMVNTSLSKSEDAIMSGEVDAILSRPPQLSGIEKALGANGVIWRAQSSQSLYAVMIARNNWISEHPQLVTRLLKSLARAEQFAVELPAETQAIVQKRLNLDAGYMETVWSQNQFSLTLDQSLITAMEDEARWMISNNLTTEKTVPDFANHVYIDALKAVKPEAVNIIR